MGLIEFWMQQKRRLIKMGQSVENIQINKEERKRDGKFQKEHRRHLAHDEKSDIHVIKILEEYLKTSG